MLLRSGRCVQLHVPLPLTREGGCLKVGFANCTLGDQHMHLKAVFATVIFMAGFLTGCGPSPGSVEWCNGVVQGSVTPSQEDMLKNIDKCAAHEVAS